MNQAVNVTPEKKTGEEPVFFTGQTMADVMTDAKTPQKAEPDRESQTPEPESAPTKEPEVAAVKPTPKTAPAPAEPQAETGEDEEQPVEPDPYDGIVQKYGGDTKKMAKAIANLQKGYTQKSQTLKRLLGSLSQQPTYQAPSPAATPEKPMAAGDDDIDATVIQEIANELATNPTEGLKRFLIESRKQGARAVESYDANRRKQEAEAQRAAVEQENLRVISNRAREILLERAQDMGEDDLVKKYSNTKYSISEDEYIDAYDQLDTEVNYINENFAPKNGRITAKLFDAARFGIDPENFNNNHRLSQARQAVEPDEEIEEAAPSRPLRQQKTRTVLSPKASTNKASVKFDPKKFDGTRTEFQEKVWTMSDAELDALERQLVR